MNLVLLMKNTKGQKAKLCYTSKGAENIFNQRSPLFLGSRDFVLYPAQKLNTGPDSFAFFHSIK